jgi:hypothetical protein
VQERKLLQVWYVEIMDGRCPKVVLELQAKLGEGVGVHLRRVGDGVDIGEGLISTVGGSDVGGREQVPLKIHFAGVEHVAGMAGIVLGFVLPDTGFALRNNTATRGQGMASLQSSSMIV